MGVEPENFQSVYNKPGTIPGPIFTINFAISLLHRMYINMLGRNMKAYENTIGLEVTLSNSSKSHSGNRSTVQYFVGIRNRKRNQDIHFHLVIGFR